MEIIRIDQTDRAAVDAFIIAHWYTTEMAVHGEVIDLSRADGFCACEGEEIVGLVTYRIIGREAEMLSLDSVYEGRGTGTALVKRTAAELRGKGIERIKVTTTNDDINALRFYQKRGFDMTALRCGAVEQARRIKPDIPLVGMDGIPIRHEIDLEMIL